MAGDNLMSKYLIEPRFNNNANLESGKYITKIKINKNDNTFLKWIHIATSAHKHNNTCAELYHVVS